MIGLFLGDTKFPKLILKKIIEKKKKYFILDLSKKNIYKKDPYSHRISIGKFGKILKLVKEKNCSKVIFAGKITKPSFSKLRLDLTGIYHFPRIIKASKKGDAAILKELIKILSSKNINVINSISFNKELALVKGYYSKEKPNISDLNDIRIGIKALSHSNSYDHIQAVVVRDKVVIKETLRGTKKLIQSIKKKNKFRGVLIKFPKKKQDLRVDLPTVGLDTLKDCKKAGIKGIVLKNKQNIFLEKKACISFANKNKMFILVK